MGNHLPIWSSGPCKSWLLPCHLVSRSLPFPHRAGGTGTLHLTAALWPGASLELTSTGLVFYSRRPQCGPPDVCVQCEPWLPVSQAAPSHPAFRANPAEAAAWGAGRSRSLLILTPTPPARHWSSWHLPECPLHSQRQVCGDPQVSCKPCAGHKVWGPFVGKSM